MATNDPFQAADRLLAAVDFSGMAASLEEEFRRETSRLLLGVVEVLDGLETLQAYCEELANAGFAQAPCPSVQGLVKQLRAVLAQAGATPIEVVGHPLDLESHDVAAVRPDATVEADTILEEQRRGYRWRQQLLRRARVVVAGPSA